MSDLGPYKAKRRFGVTSEPEGAPAPARRDGMTFVVQKHHARRLHYDFRLEINGALRSWAVPEGPCLDTKVRRLAVQTEDHPMEYGSFEGRIPSGQYGAGVVIVWDNGTWVTLENDIEAALKAGELKFRLLGHKLRGGWTLVRLKDGPKNWLLIKERDEEVRPLAEYDVLKEAPNSVITGMSVEELARKAPPLPRASPKKATAPKLAKMAGAKLGAMPGKVAPQLASQVDAPPEGPGWVHEIKYDGYRTIARIENGAVTLYTRNQHDWTKRYGVLADAFKKLPCKSAVLDGEIAVQDARGVTSIAMLEQALSEGRTHELTFFAFDLLHLDGYDLTGAKLSDRKAALDALIAPVTDARAPIQVSEHIEGDGAAFFAHACRLGLEGIMSKRADAPYVQRRTKTWVKVKRAYVGDFIVVGFTVTAPKRVSALILAEEDASGALQFVGRVSSGLTDQTASDLFKQLSKHAAEKPPVAAPKIPGAVTWTVPSLTARIAFNSRADDGAPRQPVLIGTSPYKKLAPATKPKLVTDRDLAAIRLTNPDREIFEGSGVNKLDVAIYYARVGDWMLPDLMRRPVSIIRCPTGALKDCFYQRHAFPGLPPGIGTIPLSDEEGRGDYLFIEDARGFLSLTQFGAIEFHPWPCKVDDPEHPDRFVVDLDPDPAVGWPQILAAAEQLRARLQALGFEPFVRTTGGKGLHLVMALAPGCDWKTLRGFAEAFARSVAHDAPTVFTNSPTKPARKGRIYVDYLRNVRGSSAVASYSLRARPDFGVATPIDWSELRNLEGPQAFNRKTVLKRLARLASDPWDGLQSSATAISQKVRRDVGMK